MTPPGVGASALTPLEVAAGTILDQPGGEIALPRAHHRHPADALVAAVLPAVSRGAAVSFSGGRDSSLILAVATEVARRHGLDDPLPITLRFPGVAMADETGWQEEVVRHLGLREWTRIDVTTELDLLGPYATGALRRHGVFWPPNAYFHIPIFDAAERRAVLTGIDGDGLFSSWRWENAWHALAHAGVPAPRDLGRVAYALTPRRLREAIAGRRSRRPRPWRHRGVDEHVHRLERRAEVAEPRLWRDRVAWWVCRRYLTLGLRTLGRFARDAGVEVRHPLTDSGFVAAVAAARPVSGYHGRAVAYRELASGLLPVTLLRRSTKAFFDDAVWGATTRSFIRAWDGSGIHERLVDVDGLRTTWRRDRPDVQTQMLLHTAWLASQDRPSRTFGPSSHVSAWAPGTQLAARCV